MSEVHYIKTRLLTSYQTSNI